MGSQKADRNGRRIRIETVRLDDYGRPDLADKTRRLDVIEIAALQRDGQAT